MIQALPLQAYYHLLYFRDLYKNKLIIPKSKDTDSINKFKQNLKQNHPQIILFSSPNLHISSNIGTVFPCGIFSAISFVFEMFHMHQWLYSFENTTSKSSIIIAIETALCDIFSILKAGEISSPNPVCFWASYNYFQMMETLFLVFYHLTFIYSPFFLTFYNMNTTYIVHFLFSILKMTCMKLYYERFQRLS